MSKEFNTLIAYVEKLSSRYFHSLSSFYVYEALCEELAPNIVGQQVAEENKVVLQDYINFFILSKEALRVYAFLELAKLFDVSDQSLHVTKIVNYAQGNLLRLNVSDFAEYNQERVFIDSLISSYQGIKTSDLLAIKKEIEKNKDLIEKIKTYRDKYLAHDDIKKVDVDINGEEIRLLFGLMERILNIFSSRLNSTTSRWDHIEKNAKEHTGLVIDHLKRFKPYRLKEIDDEYKSSNL